MLEKACHQQLFVVNQSAETILFRALDNAERFTTIEARQSGDTEEVPGTVFYEAGIVMTWNGNLRDLDEVMPYLSSLRDELEKAAFIKKLDQINAYYKENWPDLSTRFIRQTKHLNESWHKKHMTELAKSELSKLINSLHIDEADEYRRKTTDYIEPEWYASRVLEVMWKTDSKIRHTVELSKPSLHGDDNELIASWSAPDDLSSYWGKAMKSAREAEVAAVRLYRRLYGKAEDISILQVKSPNDNRWRCADIETSGRSIDVKNARRSFSSPNSYSEHCVPKFKRDRNNHDVIISAFLSQYNDHDDPAILWLGETTSNAIRKLQNEFSSEYLEITFPNGRGDSSFLPAWVFDYPIECYRLRESVFSQIHSPEFAFPSHECNIGSNLLAGRLSRHKIQDHIGFEAKQLEQRIKRAGLSRAVLSLHLLDRFCKCLVENKELRDTRIDEILFPGTDNWQFPLCVYDPLETVRNIWKVLLAISENCREQARRFSVFRLRGHNILQGMLKGRWMTIFAYCGGWLRLDESLPYVRCGQNPIHLGKNDSCPSCHRLICHHCGFCYSQCPACDARQANWH